MFPARQFFEKGPPVGESTLELCWGFAEVTGGFLDQILIVKELGAKSLGEFAGHDGALTKDSAEKAR